MDTSRTGAFASSSGAYSPRRVPVRAPLLPARCTRGAARASRLAVFSSLASPAETSRARSSAGKPWRYEPPFIGPGHTHVEAELTYRDPSDSSFTDVVVIGSGPAGLAVAARVAQNGERRSYPAHDDRGLGG